MAIHMLVIDDNCRRAIKSAVRSAFLQPMTAAELSKANERGELTDPPPPNQMVTVPPSTWCVFTVERNPDWVRHLSIVLDPRFHGNDACPDRPAVNLLLSEFGFEIPIVPEKPGSQCHLFIHVHDLFIHVHDHNLQLKSLNIFERILTFPKFDT